MTPFVLIDVAQVRANIDAMAAAASAKGQRLRPHLKTHKLAEVAELQLAAGAAGATVATIGEAEAFDHIGDLFIAYPLWPTAQAVARINGLKSRVILGIDSAAAAHAWAEAGLSADVAFSIELDSGHHRSGVRAENAPAVARALEEEGFRLHGLFTFPGHSYAPGGQDEAAADEASVLAHARALLGRDDLVLSGGSTPSATAAHADVVDEIRPGVYVFNDAQQLELSTCTSQEVALVIRSTVVSRREDLNQVIVDAGSKIVGSDRPAWATGFARVDKHPAARVTGLSEHHGTVIFPDGSELPQLGDELDIIPNHVCPVLNLVDEVQLSEGGTWKVAARGRNG